MPLILESEFATPTIVLSRSRQMTVSADVVQGLTARHVDRDRRMSVAGSIAIEGSATLERNRDIFAFGRVNGEANEFGVVTMSRNRQMSIGSTPGLGGKAILSRERAMTVRGRVAIANRDTLLILLNIHDPTAAGFGNVYSARIFADGDAYPIKAYNYQEPRGEVGISLEVTLARNTDRAAIEAASEFTFDIYDGTAWVTMFDSGSRTGTGFSFQFNEGVPADVLSLNTVGQSEEKLSKSPANNTTVYDPGRTTVTVDDFQTIYDTAGVGRPQQIVPIFGLDLYSLFQYVFVTKCGFTGYRTTIPNFPIRRVDFSITSPFYDAIAGYIGPFNPLMFVKDGIVWLIDSTASFPAGFGDPAAIAASEYLNAQFTESELGIDGYVVQYSDTDTDYDYQTNRFVDDPVETHGVFGDANYIEIARSRTYADYFKNEHPLTPVRTDKTKDVQITRGYSTGTLITIATVTEEQNYDTAGRVLTINKTHTGLVPDLASPGFSLLERTIRIERTEFLYGPDRMNVRREILKQTTKTINGLVTIDSDNKHLGKDFIQDFTDGFSAGNLKENLTVAFRPIKTITETIDQNPKGQFEVRTKTVDFLTDPPQVLNNTTDARTGDASTNPNVGSTNQVIVMRTGAPITGAKMSDLFVGEMPARFAIPLARRKLARQKQRRGNLTLKGLKLEIERGTEWEVFDRDGGSAGVFIVEGRAIAGTNLGTRDQATRQVIEIDEISR